MARNTSVPKIVVRNLQRKTPVNIHALEKFAAKAVKLCLRLPKKRPTDLAKLPEVSILMVSDRRMASLHRQFLKEPGPTDVITFQHGEIFISAETAHLHARRFGNTFARELRLYIVHGLLHLNGYDDRDKAGARRMRAVQERILARADGLK
jgi:probable rRNA maturation factor